MEAATNKLNRCRIGFFLLLLDVINIPNIHWTKQIISKTMHLNRNKEYGKSRIMIIEDRNLTL